MIVWYWRLFHIWEISDFSAMPPGEHNSEKADLIALQSQMEKGMPQSIFGKSH